MELTLMDNPHYKPPTYEEVANKITDIRPSKKKPGQTAFLYDGVRQYIPTPNPEQFVLTDNAPGRAYIAVRCAARLTELRRAPVQFRIVPKE